MKLKTNKLLTLTLATGLVAMTAGCGGSKTPAATGGGGNGTGTDGDGDRNVITTPADVAYSAWSGAVTTAADTTNNAFLAGTAAVAAVGSGTATAANLTGLPSGENATILTLGSEVTPVSATSGSTKGLNALDLGGDDTNGVGFATTGTGDGARFVAGVIAGADLGQPITAATVTGVWAGLFQAVGDAAHTTRKAFTLTVTFGATDGNTITALVAANDNLNAYAVDADTSYYISGTYDAAGVITGNVLYGDFATGNADRAAALVDAASDFTDATAAGATGAATNGVGTLSGLIGEDGVLGAFYSSGADGTGATGFAGGFVASKTPDVGGDDPDAVYADWEDSVTPVTTTTANGFVANTPAGLTIVALRTRGSALTLGDDYEAGFLPTSSDTNRAGTPGALARPLPGSGDDGVEFADNGDAGERRYFAGLFHSTDLGAPITAAGDITGTWNGLFQAIGNADHTTAKTFVLTVTFGATDGNTITGLVAANDNANTWETDADTSYYISGTYDENGVITGSVLYGDFATGNANDGAARTDAASSLTTALGTTGSPSTVGLGVLSGLIGKTEAVGAFYSSGSDGTGLTGYAGGFVATSATIAAAGVLPATPFNPISYTDWTGSFSSPTLPTDSATTAPAANAFVTGTATGLSLPATGNTVVSLTLNSGALTGDVLDGVAFGSTTTSPVFYAGLLNTTDLNGPLTDATAGGAWTGLFQAVGATGYETAAKNFTLTVDFGTTAFNAHVPVGATTVTDASASGVNSYYLAGTFVAATGVMTGTIIRGDYSAGTDAAGARGLAVTALGDTTNVTAGRGTVTGLIGQGGAIGAFFSADTGATGYAGGFVANNP